ncbi:MAG: transposase family protein, partial [Candidatus Syntropharchaeia archaeon]
MKFEELTEGEWELIEPLLPPPAPTGRPRADDRKRVCGIQFSRHCKIERTRLALSLSSLSRSIVRQSGQKRGECVDYNGHKMIKGTKIHVSVSKEGIPLSIEISAANHDSPYFI